jgi:hypothetical protein
MHVFARSYKYILNFFDRFAVFVTMDVHYNYVLFASWCK